MKNFGSTAEGKASWIVEYVDGAGYPADPRIHVDPATGKEELRK